MQKKLRRSGRERECGRVWEGGRCYSEEEKLYEA